MSQVEIYHGSHENIPPSASAGLLFLRDVTCAVDSPNQDPSPLQKFVSANTKFIFNGGTPVPADKVMETLRMRTTKVSKYVHQGDIAWDIAKEDGTHTVMYESTSIIAFKEDPEGVEARVREFSVLELAKADDDRETWKLVEMRTFMDPSPTEKSKRLGQEPAQ